jgi:Tfp pilus assembly protein FimT
LFELLLVLTLLVIVTGMIWPAVEGLIQRSQLAEAAEGVRTHFSRTRLWAIETGLIYQFQYEPGGRQFAIRPLEADAVTDASASPTTPGPTYSGQLPESMRFGGLDSQQNNGVQLMVESVSGFAIAGGSDATSWSPPILFVPDGTAIDATVNVLDSENRYVQLTVRGLTAVVKVSGVLRKDAS